MRLFQAALDTPRDSPFSATLSVHGLHFTVYALSIVRSFNFIRGKGAVPGTVPLHPLGGTSQ